MISIQYRLFALPFSRRNVMRGRSTLPRPPVAKDDSWYNYAMSDKSERERLIREKVRSEDEGEALATGDAKLLTGRLLAERGYPPGELEVDKEFVVTARGRRETASVDYIIKLRGRPYMAIKCSMALVSRQRHVLAFSRAVDDRIIPYSAVTDGIHAHIMETSTGRVISESLEGIPSREEAMKELQYLKYQECLPEKKEKEAMILQAFECASCPSAPEE